MGAKSASIPHWYDSSGDEPLNMTDGDGARVYDHEGNEYLDFLSQLYCANAGFSNDRIIEAMYEQLNSIPYVSSSKHNTTRMQLADKLAEVAPEPLNDVFFSISGSEANESAVKFAREYQDAPKVLTRWRSYHGSTYGAASLTGDPSTRATLERYAATSGSAKFLPPVDYRGPFDADSPEELAEQAADHLEYVIRNEGPDSVAAVLTEPIGGSAGAYTAPPGYFERVREICDEYDVLMISDEVICGFGRCGDWFGIQTEGVQPDMVTFAKAVTSAYAPLAGVMVRPEIADHLREEGISTGQTFGGHPVACAAGVAALEEYENGLIDNVKQLAPVLEEQLHTLESHDVVGDIRGRGFHWAIEFTNPATGEPFVDPMVDHDEDNPVKELAHTAQDHGLIIGTGRPDHQILLSPPLCIDKDDIAEAVDVLDQSIEQVFG
ncbi:MAG: aminotransferase class III-fold pyridoxal phosphate-dependent enzyme [Halobacteriales archaeon]|nr:aminotransferase class III-fold pyridoxal phosphate-dependent enzyme [Halobacteriales archaeon]